MIEFLKIIIKSYQLNEYCFQNKTIMETIFLLAFDHVEIMLYYLQDCGNIKITWKLCRIQRKHQSSNAHVNQE